MISSSYELQVVFWVLVLLALMSVAVMVDYLKGMNERLRERHIDLMARHQEVVQRVEKDNTKLLRALAEQSKSFRELNLKAIVVNTESTELAAAQKPLLPARRGSFSDSDLERQLNPSPSLQATPIVEEPSQQAAVVDGELPPNVVRIRLNSEDSSAPAPAANFDDFLEEVLDEFSENIPETGFRTETKVAGPVVESAQPADLSIPIPAGVHPRSVLAQLLEYKGSFTGMSLAISINYYMEFEEVHGSAIAEELLNTIDSLMAGLVSQGGFLTRRADDEFLLLFPDVSGDAAHAKLTSISESLWN
ncbi:MAG: hypothetical protein ACK5ZU_13160 [Acidobacteriota bacterium]